MFEMHCKKVPARDPHARSEAGPGHVDHRPSQHVAVLGREGQGEVGADQVSNAHARPDFLVNSEINGLSENKRLTVPRKNFAYRNMCLPGNLFAQPVPGKSRM